MGLVYYQGDLLSPANLNNSIIAHGCNAQGVMGSGIAKQIRAEFPNCYNVYNEYHKKHGLKLGDVVEYSYDGVTIFNCVTQENYGTQKIQVDYDAIAVTMETLVIAAGMRGLTPKIPLIGAGLAGGSWKIISDIITKISNEYEIDVHIWVFEKEKFVALAKGESIG